MNRSDHVWPQRIRRKIQRTYSVAPGDRNCEIETAVWIYVGNRSLLPWNAIRDFKKRPILLRNSLAGSNPWFYLPERHCSISCCCGEVLLCNRLTNGRLKTQHVTHPSIHPSIPSTVKRRCPPLIFRKTVNECKKTEETIKDKDSPGKIPSFFALARVLRDGKLSSSRSSDWY